MAHPRGSDRKRSYSLDRARVCALHARYATEDDISTVHNDGVRHPLPIVGDEGTGCEALGVVREIHVRGSGRPAQDAQAAGGKGGHAAARLVDEEEDLGLLVDDGVPVVRVLHVAGDEAGAGGVVEAALVWRSTLLGAEVAVQYSCTVR